MGFRVGFETCIRHVSIFILSPSGSALRKVGGSGACLEDSPVAGRVCEGCFDLLDPEEWPPP